jgi:hypothetical protein
MPDETNEAHQPEEVQQEVIPGAPVEQEQPVDTEDTGQVDQTEEKPQPEPIEPKAKTGFKQKLAGWRAAYMSHKKIAIPATVLVLLLAILAVPVSRYPVLGLFIKKDVIVYTIDSKTKGTVLSASIRIDGKQSLCGGKRTPYPNCLAKIPVGKHKVTAEAENYQTAEKEITVGLGKSKEQNVEVSLVATGRPVSLRINNKLTGKALTGVHIKSGKAETVTNQYGDGSIVVDPSLESIDVEISGDGYNTLKTKTPTNQTADSGVIEITPAGKVYFLSKRTGKINVMKSDLDGANAEVVLAATGNEEDGDTILLASQDWKYLALKSKRDKKPSLYLIDTTNGDKLTTMDEGDATFTLTGWSGHTFVYQVQRDKVQFWQPKRQSIKSYNAETAKINALDDTVGEGTGNSSYSGTDYKSEYQGNIILTGGTVVYTKNWSSGIYTPGNGNLSGKQNGIYTVSADGQNKKLVKGFDATTSNSIESRLYAPGEVYFRVYTNSKPEFYELENGSVQTKGDLTAKFDSVYPTYLFSPSNSKTFWAEARDGKNTLFIGDEKGDNGKTVMELSEYTAYGWYTENYLLMSKDSSELYAIGVDTQKNWSPYKITDYHKPNFIFQGYGGGYGGL